MMVRKFAVLVLSVAALTSGCKGKVDHDQETSSSTQAVPAVQAQPTHQLELFGVKLKGVSRNELNNALMQKGLSKQTSKADQWTDTYAVNGKLKGAETLRISYILATNQFANAEYEFPTFMDTQLVKRVIDLVSQKYGDPTTMNGQIELGSVDAEWDNGDGMTIHVSRGWPSTTTYLDYIDTDAYAKMKAEQDAAKQQNLQNSAKQQSQAF
jgi:uncharacterized protein YeaO (DUF488 family)